MCQDSSTPVGNQFHFLRQNELQIVLLVNIYTTKFSYKAVCRGKFQRLPYQSFSTNPAFCHYSLYRCSSFYLFLFLILEICDEVLTAHKTVVKMLLIMFLVQLLPQFCDVVGYCLEFQKYFGVSAQPIPIYFFFVRIPEVILELLCRSSLNRGVKFIWPHNFHKKAKEY